MNTSEQLSDLCPLPGNPRCCCVKKKAITAIAHTLLKIAYQVLATGTPYQEPGADFYTRRESPEQRQAFLHRPAGEASPWLHHHHHHQPPAGRADSLVSARQGSLPRAQRGPSFRVRPKNGVPDGETVELSGGVPPGGGTAGAGDEHIVGVGGPPAGVNETTLRNWVHAHLAEEARAADPLKVSPSESGGAAAAASGECRTSRPLLDDFCVQKLSD